jgi:hypothetical protein
VKFRGDWYSIPDRPLLAELAYVEGKLDADFDDLHSAQALLALTFMAVKRVRPKLRWDEIASLPFEDLDIEGDDQDDDDQEGEQAPTPPDGGAGSATSEPPTSPDSATSSAGDPPTSTP